MESSITGKLAAMVKPQTRPVELNGNSNYLGFIDRKLLLALIQVAGYHVSIFLPVHRSVIRRYSEYT